MSALPERTVEATARTICARGFRALNGQPATWERHGDDFKATAVDGLAAAMDPALGPDRLVVAGPFEQEIVEKVCAWIHDNEAWLEGRYITDAIREHFIPSPESNT